MTVVPVAELARRICNAYHPHYGTVAQVPCGAHLAAARNVYGLCADGGTLTFNEVVRARREAGLDRFSPAQTTVTVTTEVEIDEVVMMDPPEPSLPVVDENSRPGDWVANVPPEA